MESKRSVTALMLRALNSVKSDDRPIVNEEMRLADCMEAGIGPNELAMCIMFAVGEEPDIDLVNAEMTFSELGSVLVDAGFEPVRLVA